MHDGREDGLDPLESLDVKKAKGFADMLNRMSKTAFGGRALGESLDVLKTMAVDKDCTIVLTVSGAMTVAKMGLVICDMIENGLAHIVITTGAMMAHGLSEAVGGVHYKYNPLVNDKMLHHQGYNRVYDTLEMEQNLFDAESTVHAVLARIDGSRPTCSSELNREIGRELVNNGQMPSVLGCAFQKGVPVYVPAFTDSELGLDLVTFFLKKTYKPGGEKDLDKFFASLPSFNPFLDLSDYTKRILGSKRLGIVTIGGGVPRNWGQQCGPFAEIINQRVGSSLPEPRFQYGVRICPEPVHWGGLSGCTYSEGVSWGKFVSPEDGGRYAEVHCDATIAWPILIRAVLESLGRTNPKKG